MKINEKGLELIKQFEGLRLQAYTCPAGVLTIGYGHTKGVGFTQKITEEQADQFLRKDVKIYEDVVNRLIISKLTENQFSALVAFVFNIGEKQFSISTLRKKVNADPNDESIYNEFLRWSYGGGKKLNGLTNRRTAEANLYFSK